MGTTEILEEKKEETAENDGTQNELTDDPSDLATVSQRPVENDDDGGDSDTREEEDDPEMGTVIQNMLESQVPSAAQEQEGLGGEDGKNKNALSPRAPSAAQEQEGLGGEDGKNKNALSPRAPSAAQEQEGLGGEDGKNKNALSPRVPAPNPPGNGNTDGGEEVLEESNLDILNLAVRVGDGHPEQREQEGSFDSLPQLKELKNQQPGGSGDPGEPDDSGDNAAGNGNDARELLEKVNEARRGNIYSAVVLAKGLEQHQPNPFASSRASRFFNSSKLDKAFDANKVAMGVNGIASAWSADYAGSKLGNSISLITNIIAMVGSLRDLAKKIRAFRHRPKMKAEMESAEKKGIIRDDAFAVLGMISDAATVLLRVCGIAKAIAGLAGQGKSLFAKVTGYVSTALAGFTQIVGLSTSVNQMLKLKENKKKVEAGRDAAGARVDEIARDHHFDGEAANSRTDLALALMKQDGVTEEEKDDLVKYLMLERKAGKINEQVMNGIFGLTTLSTGLISTITGSVSAGLKEKQGTEKQKKQSANADLANQIAGTVSNSALIVGSAKNLTQGVIKKVQEKNPSDTVKALQGRATGVLDEMKDDKYGLRGIAQGLMNNPNDDQKAAATEALGKYAAADKRLQGLGVDYGVLLKSHDEKAFEKALVAGI